MVKWNPTNHPKIGASVLELMGFTKMHDQLPEKKQQNSTPKRPCAQQLCPIKGRRRRRPPALSASFDHRRPEADAFHGGGATPGPRIPREAQTMGMDCGVWITKKKWQLVRFIWIDGWFVLAKLTRITWSIDQGLWVIWQTS